MAINDCVSSSTLKTIAEFQNWYTFANLSTHLCNHYN